MPGIDRSRLIKADDVAEIVELMCGICLAILVDPMFTNCCRQTYCNDCIIHWLNTRKSCPNDRRELSAKELSKPPRVLSNLLNRLRFCCEFKDDGCEEIITFEYLTEHVKSCAYNPHAICNDCGEINGPKKFHNCFGNFSQRIKTLDTKSGELVAKISELERLNNMGINKIRKLNEKVFDIEEECMNREMEIKVLKEENDRLTKESQYYFKELTNLTAQVKSSKQFVDQLMAKIDDIRNEGQKFLDDLEKSSKDLEHRSKNTFF